MELEDCPALVEAWAAAALGLNKDAIILVHGGAVAEPADAEFILANTKTCHGFYGASSMERLPVEVALTEEVRTSKTIRLRRAGVKKARSVRVTKSQGGKMSGVMIGQLVS